MCQFSREELVSRVSNLFECRRFGLLNDSDFVALREQPAIVSAMRIRVGGYGLLLLQMDLPPVDRDHGIHEVAMLKCYDTKFFGSDLDPSR